MSGGLVKQQRQPDLKIILLGDSGVGKTSIVSRYISSVFEADQPATIGALFQLKTWRDKKFCIWDTAGQEKFSALSSFYCRGAHAALVVYDLTERESFNHLQKHYEMLKNQSSDCLVIFVGSKYDLVEENFELRKVTFEEACKFAASLDAKNIETSARLGFNIDRLFDMVGENFFPDSVDSSAQKPAPIINIPQETIILQPQPPPRRPAEGQEECCSQG